MGLCQQVAERARKAGVKILHGHAVQSIVQQPHQVSLEVTAGKDQQKVTITAKRAVVAAPLNLVAETIAFEPALSPSRTWLAKHVNMVSRAPSKRPMPIWHGTLLLHNFFAIFLCLSLSQQGCYSKFILVYKNAFWKEKGYSGESLNLQCRADNSLIYVTFDYSTVTDKGKVGGW